MVEAADGRTHYAEIGKGENVEPHASGATPVAAGSRESDRTIAAVAAANGGRHDVEAHLRHDPSATEVFAETHVRRLEAMRRLTGGVSREADGIWIIAPYHLDRAAAYEAVRAKARPVSVAILSPQARRRQWLVAQGFAEEVDGGTVYRAGMIAALQRRELLRRHAARTGTGYTVRREQGGRARERCLSPAGRDDERKVCAGREGA